MGASSTHALRRLVAFEVLSIRSLPATQALLGALCGREGSALAQFRTYCSAVERAQGKRRGVGGAAGVTHPDRSAQPFQRWHTGRSMGTETNTQTDAESNSDTLILTRAAVEKIKELQRRRENPNVGLRLLVSGGGCSGFQYEFEISDGQDVAMDGDEDGIVVDVDGAKLFCDGMSLSFVKGSTIDYENDMIQSKFVVSENPNAELGCGCGSSFSVAM